MNKPKSIIVEIPILDSIDEMKVVNTFTEKQLWYVCVIAKAFEKTQSNWNSLREWLEKQKHDTEICKEWNSKNNFNDIDYDRDIKRFDFVLNKMNELEGKDMK